MGERISTFVAYSCILQAFLILPGSLISLITGKFEPDDKISVLYEGIKTESRFTLSYYLVFIIRRMLFCAIAFNFENNPVYQFQALYMLNLSIAIYVGLA